MFTVIASYLGLLLLCLLTMDNLYLFHKATSSPVLPSVPSSYSFEFTQCFGDDFNDALWCADENQLAILAGARLRYLRLDPELCDDLTSDFAALFEVIDGEINDV